MNEIDAIQEDLNILPGTGATMSIGSDSYPYYVSEALPNGVFGLYSPKSCFDGEHPWEGGSQVVDNFDPKHESEFYVKRRYKKWWKVEKNGKPIARFTGKYHRLHFGHAYSYQNPSF